MEKSVKKIDNETESAEDDEDCSANLRMIDIYKLEIYLKEFVVCQWCNSKIEMEEKLRACAGLGTKFSFHCKIKICISHEKNDGFHNIKQDGQIYQINRKSILASELLAKVVKGYSDYVMLLVSLTLSAGKRLWSTQGIGKIYPKI